MDDAAEAQVQAAIERAAIDCAIADAYLYALERLEAWARGRDITFRHAMTLAVEAVTGEEMLDREAIRAEHKAAPRKVTPRKDRQMSRTVEEWAALIPVGSRFGSVTVIRAAARTAAGTRVALRCQCGAEFFEIPIKVQSRRTCVTCWRKKKITGEQPAAPMADQSGQEGVASEQRTDNPE